MPERLLTFVHISDTHIHSDPTYTGELVSFTSRASVNNLIQHINDLPFPVDFILHTGDVMTDPVQVEEYHVAREILGNLRAPVYYVPGNHDTPEMLQVGLLGRDLNLAKRPYYYEFEVNGVQIVCLDSSIYGGHAGFIDERQLSWLDDICSTPDSRPLVVGVHHHILPLEAPWLDNIMMTNGIEVHHTLLKAKNRLRGVFFGHIHENTITIRDGISYISTLSSWFQTRTWYGQTDPGRDPVVDPGFNVVTLTKADTLIRGYRLPKLI